MSKSFVLSQGSKDMAADAIFGETSATISGSFTLPPPPQKKNMVAWNKWWEPWVFQCLFQGCACRIWCHAISAACDICTTCNREFAKILPCDNNVIHINLPGQWIMINSQFWEWRCKKGAKQNSAHNGDNCWALKPISDSKPLPTNYCFPGHDDSSMMWGLISYTHGWWVGPSWSLYLYHWNHSKPYMYTVCTHIQHHVATAGGRALDLPLTRTGPPWSCNELRLGNMVQLRLDPALHNQLPGNFCFIQTLH